MSDYDDVVTHEELAAFDAEFDAAEAPADFSEPIPDGTYQARVDKVSIEKRGGYVMLRWNLRIMSGSFDNRVLFKTSFIAKGRMGFLKVELSRCGLVLENLHDLPDHLEDLLDVVVEVQQKASKNMDKNGDPYVNVYINRMVAEPKREDSDVPF